MATPNNLEIEGNDFVNAGKGKFNEAIKNLPVGLNIDGGILTVVLYKGVALTVDLTDAFPTRGEVAEHVLPPVGSFDKPSLVQLAHDDDPDDLASENKVLGSAGVVRLIEKYLTPPDVITLAALLKGSSKAESNAFLLGLLKLVDANTELQTVFCQIMSRCGYTPPTTGTITHRIRNFRHFQFVDNVLVTPTLDPVYTIRFDANNCNEFRGWCFDQNNPNSSPPVRIIRDGIVTGTVTPTVDRPDVRDYLVEQGKVPSGSTYVKYGWVYAKTQADNDGVQHTFEAYGGSSTTKATTDVGAPATLICGAPVVIPGNPAPTVVGSYPTQNVTKSGDQLLDPTTGVFSDTDALTLSATLADGSPLPAGVSFYPLLAQPFNISGSFANQSLQLKLTATDTAGQKVSVTFLLVVNRTVTNPVYLTGQIIGGDMQTVEGSGARVKVLNTYSDGSTNDYVGGGNFSIVIPYPNGMAISTQNGVGSITSQETIGEDVPTTLVFTFPDNRKITGPFTLKNKIAAESPIVSYFIPDVSVIEGQQAVAQVYALRQNGTRTEVTQANGSTFELIPLYPNGMSVSYGNTARALIQTAGNSVSADVPVTIRFTFAGGGTVEGKITVVNDTSVPIDTTANPPSQADMRNGHSNDFSVAAGTNPANWQPGYNLIRGSYNWANGSLCQTGDIQDTTPIVYTENGSQTSYNKNLTYAKVKISALASTQSWVGIGLRFETTGRTGYSFFVDNAGSVGLVHHGVVIGPTVAFGTVLNTEYWLKQYYEETANNTAKLYGKIWKAGEVEPNDWTVTWEGQPRENGYPALFGGSNGARVCFSKWYDGNTGAVATVYIEKIGYYVNSVGSGANPDSIGFYSKGPQASYKFYIESETTPELMEQYTAATNDPTVSLAAPLADFNHRIVQALATRVWRGHAYKCRLDIVSGSTVLQSVPFTVSITTSGTLTLAYSTN